MDGLTNDHGRRAVVMGWGPARSFLPLFAP